MLATGLKAGSMYADGPQTASHGSDPRVSRHRAPNLPGAMFHQLKGHSARSMALFTEVASDPTRVRLHHEQADPLAGFRFPHPTRTDNSSAQKRELSS
jgi:hypothetical protein